LINASVFAAFPIPTERNKSIFYELVIKNEKNIKTVWFQLGLSNNEAAQKALDSGLKVVQNKCTKIEHKAIYE